MKQLTNSDSQAAREQANIFLQTQERMRGSIVPVVAARLQFMRDEAIARFTSASIAAPEFALLRQNPAAIYWCINERDIARLRPLSAVFYSVLLEQICGIDDNIAMVPITLLLDEFANVGVIPNFETTISVVRGRGIALCLGIQSLSQLESRYGRTASQTILTNCGTKIALHGLDIETARYVSASLGDGTINADRTSTQRLFGVLPSPIVTVSDQHHGRPLLTADEVRRIKTDEAIVITGNHRPMLLNKKYYSTEPNTKSATPTPLGQALLSIPQPAQSLPPPFPDELRTPIFK
jgi:type IV secretion system protein VirD4